MNTELIELLNSDIYTDAPEYADRVSRIRSILGTLTFADETLINEARELYQSDDVEIDDIGVLTSRAAQGEGDGEEGEPTGTWVQAWVWVADSDLGPDGKPRGENN